ncbi:carbon-nitrogen hydrolase family protein [Clostridium algoriphilum]|uniref:carbon-nitrogen hydrolase family protein n=1 Tax=Clostridium algoriphilum TaxID=198347 RepID=UPI001CF5A66B|nr:carbon-nitrogen hydrolase family protein [Clostridium algoriphilum]MCB2295217.1 carbon-nitrogen hydrolase family protein [Clostridium algoriphilum]
MKNDGVILLRYSMEEIFILLIGYFNEWSGIFMKFNVSCVQMKPERYDVKRNIKTMCGFIDKVMEENANTNLIVFPELITSGYECHEEFHKIAEVACESDSIKIIGQAAKKYKTNIIFGFPERDAENKEVLYNSAAFVNEKGELGGTYRKVHLFDTEKKYFTPGRDYPVFDTSFGKIGVMICWDTAFPEVARIYALKDVDLLVVSTNWEKPYSDDWDLVTSARAFDNCVYLAAANRIGNDDKLSFFGHSRIVSPLGKSIAELNEEIEGVISAELDLQVPLKLREEYYTFFKDRRPDTYDLLVK